MGEKSQKSTYHCRILLQYTNQQPWHIFKAIRFGFFSSSICYYGSNIFSADKKPQICDIFDFIKMQIAHNEAMNGVRELFLLF